MNDIRPGNIPVPADCQAAVVQGYGSAGLLFRGTAGQTPGTPWFAVPGKPTVQMAALA